VLKVGLVITLANSQLQAQYRSVAIDTHYLIAYNSDIDKQLANTSFMSEERFDRLENQLTQVIQGMTVMQQNLTAMQTRIDSVEGTLMVAMRSGFDSLQTAINDLNVDLNVMEIQTERNARKNRRINQRVTAIEARLDDLD
jgi:hypothetical protein